MRADESRGEQREWAAREKGRRDMNEGKYIDHRLINRIQAAERGACVVVGSEAEARQAERCIALTRPRDGLTVRVEKAGGQQEIDFQVGG